MSRLITYPARSATLSAVSPVLYSAQNTEVNQIYQDLNDLDAGVALKAGEAGQNFAVNNLTVAGAITVQSKGIMIPGFKMGGIAWQSASTPPTIKGGSVFEYRGLYYPVAADQNLASGNSALACNQSFDLNLWYKVMMDSAGVFTWMPAFDITSPLVTGRSIAAGGVVVSGTSFTINLNDTTGLTVGNIIVTKDTNGVSRTCDGAFVINTVNPGVSVIVTGKAVGNGTYNGGTIDSYSPIYTLHGALGAVSGANTGKYTPSPPFCPALGIYGFDKYGIPTATAADIVYEAIGIFFNGATSTSVSHTYSYKSGKDKNDNYAFVYGVTGCGSINNKIPIYNTILYLHGSDHTFNSSGTAGTSFTINSNRKFSASINQAMNTSEYVGISLNSANLTTPISSLTPPEVIRCVNTAGISVHGSTGFKDKSLNVGSVIRPHLYSNGVSNTFLNSFELSSIS